MHDTTAPPLAHLARLTDGTGLLQHARFGVADRRHGYCLDDNARALSLMARREGEEAARLAATYASFLDHAWDRDARGGRGRFENFLGYDRRWLPDGGAVEDEDAQARGLLALAHVAASGLGAGLADWAAMLLAEALRPPSLPLALGSPRAWAAALVACEAAIAAAGPGVRGEAAAHAAEAAPALARRLLERHRAAAAPGWPWFEDALAYDNARLSEGALAGAVHLPALREVGLASLGWLCRVQTAPAGHHRPFGNEGFGAERVARRRYDQQPIEAWATLDAALRAHALTGEARWLAEARRAHAWFTGANDAGAPLAGADGSCADGIGRDGLNANRGAESTLAWLHACAALAAHPREG